MVLFFTKRTTLTRMFYVIYEIGYYTFSIVSRIINAVFYSGSMHQTLSARTHIEARNSDKWKKRETFINRLFWFQKNHCSEAWDSEVSRAIKTLERNGDML